ncbi:MAG TPA: isoprenylcysteine carboxylmethyltransferase family protein, partial [Phycisphaerae bacterium]|nr:isoprenylcysteine carboxylmethyltransferase family protein [Phycisphaerae bacterium]
DHALVQEGIYGSIRHPLYLSLLLVPAGTAMVFASLLALPIFAVSVIFVADRMGREERLLGEAFGAEFRAYQKRTKMLLPGVW